MAKLPRYLTVEQEKSKPFTLTIRLKKWGIPVLVYKTMKERFDLKWYHWALYPCFCLKIMVKDGDSYSR